MKFVNAHLLSFLLLLPGALRADRPPKDDLSLRVGSFHIVQVTQESAEAEIDISVQANVDARVEHVEITDLHANGVPFFARPMDTEIEIHRGDETPLPPLSVTVYFRDLDSLEPLIRILEDDRARLQAEVELTVRAKVLEQLALGASHPVAVLNVDQMVEVPPPGGLFGRTSAIALLRVGQVALGSGGIGLDGVESDPAWTRQLGVAPAALLHARNCFSATSPACVDQLAFRADTRSAVSTAELLTPWRFDPAFADPEARSRTEGVRVTIEVLARVGDRAGSPGGPVTVTSQSVGDAPTVRRIIYPRRSETVLGQRLAPGVYGVLQLPPASEGAIFTMAPDAVRNQSRWDHLLVFRLVKEGDGTWRAAVVSLSGHLDNKSIVFSRPVDRSAAGSPILAPEGVIGMVQSAKGGSVLTPVLSPRR